MTENGIERRLREMIPEIAEVEQIINVTQSREQVCWEAGSKN